jgi:alkanesulfonate monooxygenase SsuD/methylene tetrahydromethanopterin reductase-like flavin-dependent oxidoreductase (luciferase family)
MFSMRFDLRVPRMTPAQISDEYRTAIEMVRWADDKGCTTVGVSEHHAAADGYIPSPLVLASAMAAVTNKARILVGAALLPMYDPVRLAEDMIVLDHISSGRVSYVFGIGYRPQEYQLYGLDFSKRGAIADAKLAKLLETLRDASSTGVAPRITPPSFTPGRPAIAWGGASKAAARRAGRNGLGFFAQIDTPGLREAYVDAAREAGFEPGLCVLPSRAVPGTVFVNDDLDEGWREVGPYLLADATMYAEWNKDTGHDTVNLSTGRTIDELRAEGAAHRMVSISEAIESARRWGRLPLNPLCGGCPPNIAWRYLKRAVDEVVPALRASA